MKSSFGELESEFAIHGNPKSQQALERDEEKHGPAKAGLGTGFPLVIPL